MTGGLFTIEFFEEDGGRSPVEQWMDSKLTDLELSALLSAFEHVLSHHGVNVCATEWGKQLGDGLFEFRVRHTADEITTMLGLAPAAAPGKVKYSSACSVTPSGTRSSYCSTDMTRARIRARSVSSARSDSRGSV